MTTPKPCNCSGGTASGSATATGGGGWQIELRNGSRVGRFSTESAAAHSLRTTFKNAGKVIPR